MRQVILSECTILNTSTRPRGDAVILTDIDGDGHNELCVACARGCLNIFKSEFNQSTPWASGCVDEEVGEIVLLSFGLFLKETLKPLLAVVTTLSALLVKIVPGEDDEPTQLLFSGVHSPRNLTASVTFPDPQDACTDVLVVGTYDGYIHIIRFDNVIPMATLSQGNMGDNLDHMKPCYHTRGRGGITSLARVNSAHDNTMLLVIGLVDGSFEMLNWPSLQPFQCMGSISAASDVIRRDARCVNVGSPIGSKFCVATLSGHLTLCELKSNAVNKTDFNDIEGNDSDEPALSQYSLGAEIELDEPLIAISHIPALSTRQHQPPSSTFAVSSCSGKTILFDCKDSVFNHVNVSGTAACLFDPAPLFTAPLKTFIAGGYRPAHSPPSSSSTCQVDDHSSISSSLSDLSLGSNQMDTRVGKVDTLEDSKDEPCLIYVLGNGEILVFHSLRAQMGDEVRPCPLLDILEQDLPGSLKKLKDIKSKLMENGGHLTSLFDDGIPASSNITIHRGCAEALLSEEAATLRNILYYPTAELLKIKDKKEKEKAKCTSSLASTEPTTVLLNNEANGDAQTEEELPKEGEDASPEIAPGEKEGVTAEIGIEDEHQLPVSS